MKNSYLYKRAVSLTTLSPKIKSILLKIMAINFFYELIKIVPPIIFKEIIDSLVAYDPATGFTPELVMYLVLGYALSLFIMSLMDIFLQNLGDRGIRDAEEDVVTRTFEKLLLLDLSYHERNNTGASVNKVIKGHARLVELLYNLLNGFLPVVFQALITLVVLFWLSWKIGLVFLLFIPIFVVVIIQGAKRTQPTREEYHKHHDDYAASITQSVANIRTVKDFGNEEKELEKSRVYLRRYLVALSERIRLGIRNLLLEDMLITAARAVTLVLAVYLMMHGNITAGSLVLIVTLSEKAFINLTRLRWTYYRMQEAEPSIDRFHQIFGEKIKVKDNVASTLSITEGQIIFDHVSFKYEEGGQYALKDVSFTIEPKQTVAFVGRSGAGKSTVVKLMLRLDDVDDGTVHVDGHAVQDYSFRGLRGAMAVVAQDVELFNASIAENIAYGVENATLEEIEHAAKLANAHDFIARFRDGYNTVVGERGVKLSGGQKQRIAIARALIRKPKVLIFDEATSSLDAESERKIHEAIFALQGKLTLIIIAHRFSTIEHADKIVLLENGTVAEMGTHAELVKKQGIFARLRKLQELSDLE